MLAKQLKKKLKEQRSGFLSFLLGKSGAILSGNLIAGKGIIRAGDGLIRTGQYFSCCLILWLILKYKDIMKMNRSFMVFIQQIR